MSGGGGGDGEGFGSGGDFTPDCSGLKFETQLTSPQPAVVKRLSVGDILEVKIKTSKGQVVVQVLKDFEVAGGLTGPKIAQLRKCLEQGSKFRVTVRSINRGEVKIFVEYV